jgi:AcrR family transcriptional regulator
LPAKIQEKRRYSGQSFEDRQAERRAKLVRATLEVAGRVGPEGVTVAAICAEAGLTARYFYESFQSREAIFVEAYRLAQDELLGEMTPNIDSKDAIRSGLTALYRALAAHPGQARVFLVDLDDSDPLMKAASREGAAKFAKLFAPNATKALEVAGILGAIIQIAKRWIDSGFEEPVEEVVAIALPFTKPKA